MKEYEISELVFQCLPGVFFWGLFIWGEMMLRKKYPNMIQRIGGREEKDALYVVSVYSRKRGTSGYIDFIFLKNGQGKFYLKNSFDVVFSYILSVGTLIVFIPLAIFIFLNFYYFINVWAILPSVFVLLFGVLVYWIAGRERIAARLFFNKYKKEHM